MKPMKPDEFDEFWDKNVISSFNGYKLTNAYTTLYRQYEALREVLRDFESLTNFLRNWPDKQDDRYDFYVRVTGRIGEAFVSTIITRDALCRLDKALRGES